MDLLVGESAGFRCDLRLYIRQADGSLKGMGPVQVDGEDIYFYERSKARFIDFDGDGLKDLIAVSTDENLVRIFNNIGTASEPKFSDFTYLEVGGEVLKAYSGCVDFGDLNGDGLFDLVLSNGFKGNIKENAYFRYALNVGTSESPEFSTLEMVKGSDGEPYTMYKTIYAMFFSLYDWNNDGKLDIISPISWRGVQILENISDPTGNVSFKEMSKIKLSSPEIKFSNNKIVLGENIESQSKLDIYTINGKCLLSTIITENMNHLKIDFCNTQKLLFTLQNRKKKIFGIVNKQE